MKIHVLVGHPKTKSRTLAMRRATTWMDCEIVYESPAGDYTVVVFKIHYVGHVRGAPPVIFRTMSA